MPEETQGAPAQPENEPTTQPTTPATTDGTNTEQTSQPQQPPQTQAEQPPIIEIPVSVLREEDEKSLRCGSCGRHIVSIITHHAVVRGTCQRKGCKKVNEFHVQGNKTINEVHDKPRIDRY